MSLAWFAMQFGWAESNRSSEESEAEDSPNAVMPQRRSGLERQMLPKGESLFRELVELAPDAMVIADQEGKIVLVNIQTEKMFGYRRQELLGQPVEVLVPERFRGQNVAHRQNYSAEPRVPPMTAGLELYGRRKDGSEFPVEISLSPLHRMGSALVSSAIREIVPAHS